VGARVCVACEGGCAAAVSVKTFGLRITIS
jgi:hypothetical protein